jgi:hypothetical protein
MWNIHNAKGNDASRKCEYQNSELHTETGDPAEHG